MIIFIGGALTVVSVIYIVVILICIMGIGFGAAALAPVLKGLCYIISYLVVIISLVISVMDIKNSNQKNLKAIDWINTIITPIFNIILFSMAITIFLIPTYEGIIVPFESLVDAILYGIGFLIMVPLLGMLIIIAIAPYFGVITLDKKEQKQGLILPSGVLSFILLIGVWYIMAYYGNYKENILTNPKTKNLLASFQILPPGIRQIVQGILINGGEFVRNLIFN